MFVSSLQVAQCSLGALAASRFGAGISEDYVMPDMQIEAEAGVDVDLFTMTDANVPLTMDSREMFSMPVFFRSPPSDIGETPSNIKEIIAGRANAFRDLHDALSDNTGDVEEIFFRLEIVKVLARSGMFEEAFAIDMGDEEHDAMRAMVIERASSEMDGGPERGYSERASAENIKIVMEMLMDGDIEAALAFDSGDPSENALLKLEVAKVLIMAERYQEALAIDTGSKRHNIYIVTAVADAQAKKFGHLRELNVRSLGDDPEVVGARLRRSVLMKKAHSAIETISGTWVGAFDLIRTAPLASDQELVDMGAAMSIQEIRLVAASLADLRERIERATDFMMAGHLSTWRVRDIESEERVRLMERHMELVSNIVRRGGSLTIEDPSALILYYLEEISENGSPSASDDAGNNMLD